MLTGTPALIGAPELFTPEPWVGRMYDTVGFHQAYLILGSITLSFTIASLFTLKGSKMLLQTTEYKSAA